MRRILYHTRTSIKEGNRRLQRLEEQMSLCKNYHAQSAADDRAEEIVDLEEILSLP